MKPLYALVALIAVAIAIAALTANMRPPPDRPPAEQSQEEMQKEIEAMKKAQQQQAEAKKKMPTGDDRLKAFDKVKEGAIRAELEIENRGKMVLELYPKAAPKTVEHVVSLIKQGFYNGIKFHRVEPGFVVQGGDPQSKNLSPEEFSANQVGSHGSGKNVPLEATLPHLPNSVGLARAQDPNSGDSQFYINLKDNGDALDGGYCVFGMVVEGAEIAPKIEVGDKIKSFKLQ